MMHILISLMNASAAVFMLLAVIWGWYNYQHEMPGTEFWVVYAVAAAIGVLFTGVRAVEWAGVHGPDIDLLAAMLGLIAGTMLATSALICAASPIKRQVK